MDITYIAMARGFVDLAVALDWFSCRVLARRLSITTEAASHIQTLEDAGALRQAGDIQQRPGSQFTAKPSPARSPAMA